MKNTIAFWLLLMATSACAQRKHLLNDYNFNSGKFQAGIYRAAFDSVAQVITDSVSRKGNRAVRMAVKADPMRGDKGIRSEFQFPYELAPERWYGVSIFAPSSYLPDSDPDIVTQWHAARDAGSGEGYASPSLSLRTRNGGWVFQTLWDTAKITVQNKFTGRASVKLGDVKLNAWTDWVFHIKFSYKEDGLVEIYQNGNLVYTRKGPNCYNDEKLPYWKVGIYKPSLKNKNPLSHLFQQRVLYFSNIRRGDENATYNDVAP